MLVKDGYFVAIASWWNSFAKIRQDMFGFIDLLAISGNDTLAVQTTSGANVSHRVNKLKMVPGVKIWLSSPNRRLVVHGWAKRGAQGKAKKWTCRTVNLWLHNGQVHDTDEVSTQVGIYEYEDQPNTTST